MKYFLDTEFHEYEIEADIWVDEGDKITRVRTKIPTIDLISIGIKCDDGREFYRVSKDFHVVNAFNNEWLRENVLRTLDPRIHENSNDVEYFREWIRRIGVFREQIASEVFEFIGNDEKPQIYAYYADYDWVVFCWLFGRMIDLPKHFPMYCRDLKQIYDELEADYQATRLHNRDYERSDIPKNLKKFPNYPAQTKEHNALADARWNFELYNFLKGDYRNGLGERDSPFHLMTLRNV